MLKRYRSINFISMASIAVLVTVETSEYAIEVFTAIHNFHLFLGEEVCLCVTWCNPEEKADISG